MKTQILTSGVDSEYVLGELASHLRLKGWDVTELNFGASTFDPKKILGSLNGPDTVYITSAHTNLTLRTAEVLVGPGYLYSNYLSPIEIIKIVKPRLALYVPHDLLTPYGGANEFRFLSLYDLVLSPTNDPALQATLGPHTKVINAGWIKHAGRSPQPRSRDGGLSQGAPRIALFVSMIDYLRNRYGNHGVVEYLRPLLRPQIKIKLPAWRGVDEIEEILKATTSVEVIPADTNSTDLILNSDIVICNGASSIHAEATLLGRACICILDNEGISASEQRTKLRHYPDLHFHDYRDRQPISDDVFASVIARAKQTLVHHFDFDLVERLITPRQDTLTARAHAFQEGN